MQKTIAATVSLRTLLAKLDTPAARIEAYFRIDRRTFFSSLTLRSGKETDAAETASEITVPPPQKAPTVL